MKKVLIIDTDAEFISKTTRTLKTEELKVISSSDYEMSYTLVKKEYPDLLIFGINQENIEKVTQIAQEIKSFYTEKTLPIIFAGTITNYTGYPFDPTDTNNYKPVEDFIEKDFRTEELINKLKLLFNT